MKKKLRFIGAGLIILSTVFLTGFFFDKEEGGKSSGIQPQTMADALHKVMEADRTVYTKYIIARLANKEKVIKASEHWEDEKALVLPAQMFRYGSELVAESNPGFSYSLLSQWPVNAQNKPKTDVEIKGLTFISENPGKTFYAEEILGEKKYFTAVYPDVAVSEACITCHNAHKDSPRTDFKLGDVMGGVVIRIPTDS
ncbi:MAG: Tll0287-like domain-containing protein [Methylobacter sp.]